jgi:hypothetical protein
MASPTNSTAEEQKPFSLAEMYRKAADPAADAPTPSGQGDVASVVSPTKRAAPAFSLQNMYREAARVGSPTEAPPAVAIQEEAKPFSLEGMYREAAEEPIRDVKNVSTVWNDINFGFKASVHDILQAAQNLTFPIQKAADIYAERAGITRNDALKEIGDLLEETKKEYTPTEEEVKQKRGYSGRVIVGAAGMPLGILKYAPMMMLLKNPTMAFAITDAIQAANRGPMETLKAGMMGAGTGFLYSKLPLIKALPGRALAGAAIGGVGAGLSGERLEGIAAGATLGTVMGVATRAEKPLKNEVSVIEKPPDVTPIMSRLRSMSQVFEHVPEAPQLVFKTMMKEREGSNLSNGWKTRAEHIFNKLKPEDQKILIHDLDNPIYTLENLPPRTPAIRQAFADMRPLTNDIRERVIQAKREEMVNYGADPELTNTSYQEWGKQEGYFPRTWEGPWRIMYFDEVNPSTGKPSYKLIPTMAGAETKRQARIQADEFLNIPGNAIKRDQVIIVQTEPVVPPKFSKQGKRFWGHAQEREAGTGGWMDTPESLYKYIDESSRYVTTSPLRPEWERVSSWLEENRPRSDTRNMWNSYVDRMEGRPDKITSTLNEAWIRNGGRPDIVQRSLGMVRGIEATAKIGFSPVSIFMNATQVPLNTIPVLGSKWAFEGFKRFVTRADHPEYNAVLDKLHIRDAVSKLDEYNMQRSFMDALPRDMKGVPSWTLKQAQYWGLLGFTKTEYMNRCVTALGAYAKAIAPKNKGGLGLSEEAALRKAFETEVRTQFTYSTADAPAILASPWMRTAFQFKNFWVKQLEFMYGLGRKDNPLRFSDTTRAQETMRFLTSSLLLTGAVGVPFIETVDAMIKHVTEERDGRGGVSILDEAKKAFPNASRGLPGMIGVFTGGKIPGFDFSRNVGYGDYLSLRNLMNPFGPAVQEFLALTKWWFSEDGADKDALAQKLAGFSPSAKRIWEQYLSWAGTRNEVRDSKGKITAKNVGNLEHFLRATGLTPLSMADERSDNVKLYEAESREKDKAEWYATRLADAMEKDDIPKFEEIAEEATRAGHSMSIETAKSKLKNRTEMNRVANKMRRGMKSAAELLQDNPEAWSEHAAMYQRYREANETPPPVIGEFPVVTPESGGPE